MGKIKEILTTFALVTTMVVIATAIYIGTFYSANEMVSVNILWQIIIVSFLSALGNLFYPNGESTKGQMIIGVIIQYIYINVVVLGCGFYFRWFSITRFSMVFGMLILIAVIFTIVTCIETKRDKKLADSLNIILEQYQENE